MANNILTIAAALKSIYDSVYAGEESDLTEMKMHKLLYFAQKQHYSNFGKWLFEEDFEGWIHGPVNRQVRSMFNKLDGAEYEISPEEEYTLREVVYDYGKYAAPVLSNMSHEEYAYKVSRQGLNDWERGDRIISKEHMIGDIPSYDHDDLC